MQYPGYGRFHYNENIQYCRQSRGSLYELQDHLLTCLDQNYISKDKYLELLEKTEKCLKLLNGYIRMLQNQKTENRK
jgi:four helix bundle protein